MYNSLVRSWSLGGVSSHNTGASTTTSGEEDDACTTTVDGSSGHEMIDRTLSHVETGLHPNHNKDASYICAPYKTELFQQQFDEHPPGSHRRTALIGALQDLGVKVFIIDSVSTPTTADVIHHVRRVVLYMAHENYSHPTSSDGGWMKDYQRCLLYQDDQGRLFNLVVPPHAVGPVQQFVDQHADGFSNVQAVMALLVLCRILPSAEEGT
jgi:hypothetical protein